MIGVVNASRRSTLNVRGVAPASATGGVQSRTIAFSVGICATTDDGGATGDKSGIESRVDGGPARPDRESPRTA